MARASPRASVRPSLFWFLLLDGGIIVLTRLAVSKTAYDKADDMTGDALPAQGDPAGDVDRDGRDPRHGGGGGRPDGPASWSLAPRVAAADLRRRLSLAPLAAPVHRANR